MYAIRSYYDILELATQSVNKANNAGEKIKAIIPDIRRTADLVSEISASSSEQNSGAEQINAAMAELDQVIQQNAASAEEASSMSEELTAQAERLVITSYSIHYTKLYDHRRSFFCRTPAFNFVYRRTSYGCVQPEKAYHFTETLCLRSQFFRHG